MIESNDLNLTDLQQLKKGLAGRGGRIHVLHGQIPRSEILTTLAEAGHPRILFVHTRYDTAHEVAALTAAMPEDAAANLFGLTVGWEELTLKQRQSILEYLHMPGSVAGPAVSALLGLELSPIPIVLRMALELACYFLGKRASGKDGMSADDLALPIAILDNPNRDGVTALSSILDNKEGLPKLDAALENVQVPTEVTLRFDNPRFDAWIALRHGLKHEWFDRLAPICEVWEAAGIPENLQSWRENARTLTSWLSSTPDALSPARYLDSPVFRNWIEGFRMEAGELVDRWFRERTKLPDRVAPMIAEIERLTATIDNLPAGGSSGGAVRDLAPRFKDLSEGMYGLPRSVSWPPLQHNEELPELLIIDDGLGRISLSREHPDSVPPSQESRLVEWRSMLCKRMLLLDEEDPENRALVRDPVAKAKFIAGQEYSVARRCFENSLPSIRKYLRQAAAGNTYTMVLLDVWFSSGPSDADRAAFGLEQVLPMLRVEFQDLPVVMFTSEKDPKRVDQIRLQAGVDYMNKDFSDEVLLVQKLWDSQRVEKSQWRSILHLPDDLIAEDPAMLKALLQAWFAARDKQSRPVLLTGSSGSGKSTIARWIHQCSRRSEGPYREVISGSLERQFVGPELFGFYKGSHSEAKYDTPGKFHDSDGGTLFLDEIADLPSEVQMKLKGVLDSPTSRRMIRAAGPDQTGKNLLDREVDVRVICATDKDPATHLDRALVMRLGDPITIPGLDQRPLDVFAMAKYFITSPKQLAKPLMRLDRGVEQWLVDLFSKDAVSVGNVRGLSGLIGRAAGGHTDADVLTVQDFERALPDLRRVNVEPQGAPAATGLAQSRVSPPTDLMAAVAMVFARLDGQDWDDFSEGSMREVDRHLDGRFVDLVSCLFAWHIYRGKDLADYYRRLTGNPPNARIPQDFIKKVLTIGPQVGERLTEWGLVQPGSLLDELVQKKKKDKRLQAKPPQKPQ